MPETKRWYTCPFCKTTLEDSIDVLVAHREEGGECDQKMITILEKEF